MEIFAFEILEFGPVPNPNLAQNSKAWGTLLARTTSAQTISSETLATRLGTLQLKSTESTSALKRSPNGGSV